MVVIFDKKIILIQVNSNDVYHSYTLKLMAHQIYQPIFTMIQFLSLVNYFRLLGQIYGDLGILIYAVPQEQCSWELIFSFTVISNNQGSNFGKSTLKRDGREERRRKKLSAKRDSNPRPLVSDRQVDALTAKLKAIKCFPSAVEALRQLALVRQPNPRP